MSDYVLLMVVAVLSIAGSIIKQRQRAAAQRQAGEKSPGNPSHEAWEYDLEEEERSMMPPPVFRPTPQGLQSPEYSARKAETTVRPNPRPIGGVRPMEEAENHVDTEETPAALEGFDLRTAVIYSEILKPKYEE